MVWNGHTVGGSAGGHKVFGDEARFYCFQVKNLKPEIIHTPILD